MPTHEEHILRILGEIPAILPRMVTDILLDPPNGGRRLIVDTKFSSILESRRFGGASLKSDYLYQMYAYLRSQEGQSINQIRQPNAGSPNQNGVARV